MNSLDKYFVGLFGGINSISNSSSELASLKHQLKDVFEIHARVIEILRGIVEILHIDEDGNTLFWVSYNHRSILNRK